MSAADWIAAIVLPAALLFIAYVRGRQDGARRMALDTHSGREPCWRCKGSGVEDRP